MTGMSGVDDWGIGGLPIQEGFEESVFLGRTVVAVSGKLLVAGGGLSDAVDIVCQLGSRNML